MIQGYPDDSSGFPGDTVTFHIATDAPQFRIEFFRQGATLQDTAIKTDWLSGSLGVDHEADQDFGQPVARRDGQAVDGWEGYPFKIPDWQSGVYIAMFVEGDGNGQPNPNQNPPLDRSTPDARTGKALFVVKNSTPGIASQVLYKIPLFTYQMYNMTQYNGIDGQVHAGAGYPFHNYHTNTDVGGLWVTLHRPGGGTGGTPWDGIYYGPLVNGIPTGNLDPFDPTLRQTFVHWDAKMVSWLEGNGFTVDYCTDMDVHNDVDLSLLSPYGLVLSVGHDEYYSTQMRDNLEGFIANGGNVAFFSGNTSFWRLIFPVTDSNGQPDLRFITRDMLWSEAGRPEDSLTGVGFRHAGERDYPIPSNNSEKVGYTVQNTFLWPFENAGVAENATFGKDQCIVGYECDGVNYDNNAPRPVSPSPIPGDGTPLSLVILGTGLLSPWGGGQNGSATMAMYNTVGTVFTGGTTDWPRLLAIADLPTMAITSNVMNRLGGNSKGLAQLRTIGSLICCDGFFSVDDGFRHAIVGTSNGNITDVAFSPTGGQPPEATVFLNGLIDLGGFTAANDESRHLVALTADGNVWALSYAADQLQPLQMIIANIPNALRVCGFYTSDDQRRHAIVATNEGNVFEVYYQGVGNNANQALLGTFDNIVDVGGFFSPDDNYRHAIIGTADGNVTEIYFNPGVGIFQAVIANVPDLAKVSAYYAANDNFFNRRVQVLSNGGRIHEVRYEPKSGIMRTVLFNTGGLVDIGGFFSGDDSFRHAILATPRGDVQELFFNP